MQLINSFVLQDLSKFGIQKEKVKALSDLIPNGRPFIKYYQNPNKEDKEFGFYKPCLTLCLRRAGSGIQKELLIQFSCQKALFDNNFDEPNEADLQTIYFWLEERLKIMGIAVGIEELKKANLNVVHFAKNIPLTDYTLPITYMRELAKCDVTNRLCFDEKDYRGGGHSLKFRVNRFEVCFYDKIKDLEKAKISEKWAEEKDNAIQLDLLNRTQFVKPFEAMRMEIRLNTRKKIKEVLETIGLKNLEPTLGNLFNKVIARKILKWHFEAIVSGYPLLLMMPNEDQKPANFLTSLKQQEINVSLNKALELFGLAQMLDALGVRDFRALTKSWGDDSWYRLKKTMQRLPIVNKVDCFGTISKCLNDFEPIKLVDFNKTIVK